MTFAEQISHAAAQWYGTPFREHTEIRGVGVDCVHLARAILTAAGLALPAIDVPDYPLDWAKHRSHSLVVEWLERSGKFQLLAAEATPMPGDLLCIRQGRCAHHVAIVVIGRHFVHTTPGRFVECGLVDDPAYAGLIVSRYRHVDAPVQP